MSKNMCRACVLLGFLFATLQATTDSFADAQPVISKETRPELFADQPPENIPNQSTAQGSQRPESGTSFLVTTMSRTFLVLAIVLLLAYVILGKGLPKLMALTGQKTNQSLKIREKLILDNKHSLFIVGYQDRQFLLATGDQNTSLVSELTEKVPLQHAASALTFGSLNVTSSKKKSENKPES